MSWTYSTLIAAITDWLDDTTLTAQVDTFIQLAEARFNRTIASQSTEAYTTLNASSETTNLPADATGIKIMWVDGTPDNQIEETTLANLKMLYGGQTGTPSSYAIANGQIYLGPVPSSTVTLNLIYIQKIPALTATSPTNWLLTDNPDIYLYGCLVMAEARGWNDQRLPIIKAALDEALEELKDASARKRYGGAPVQARAAVSA